MITVDWDNPDRTIILCRFEDPWTWNEYYAMSRQMAAMFDNIDHVADTIIDMTRGHAMPSGVLSHMGRAVKLHTAKKGIIILVGVGGIVGPIIQIMNRLYPKMTRHFQQASSLEDAYARIARIQSERSLNRLAS